MEGSRLHPPRTGPPGDEQEAATMGWGPHRRLSFLQPHMEVRKEAEIGRRWDMSGLGSLVSPRPKGGSSRYQAEWESDEAWTVQWRPVGDKGPRTRAPTPWNVDFRGPCRASCPFWLPLPTCKMQQIQRHFSLMGQEMGPQGCSVGSGHTGVSTNTTASCLPQWGPTLVASMFSPSYASI